MLHLLLQRLGSGSTNSRSSTDTRRYRTRARTSQVDESLFGSTKPVSFFFFYKCNNPVLVCNVCSLICENSQSDQEPETIQLITKDLIRSLRIPWRDPSGESVILSPTEFDRINAASRVLTKEESEALLQACQRKKDADIKAAEERKCQIFEADLSRKDKHALTELELEARDQAQQLVEQTNDLRMEQEEEIRKLNKLILGAHCQATRDAQIQEKKQIRAEMTEEEKRLDTMMEVRRRQDLETMEQIEELRKQQMISGMQQINEQIRQRLVEKHLQEEMKENEKQQFRENQERMNLEDLKALEKKREEQELLHEEVMRINAETVRAKEQIKEQEKLDEMRNVEYMRKKQAREAEYEEEQQRIKKEKELEIARLRAKQERAKDYQAEQDELRARRNQQIADREWRRKEREQAAKAAQEEAMLKAARLQQVHCKEHLLSMEAGREKAEFERVLKVQQEAMVKLMEEEEKQRQRALGHAEAIRQQVKERELSAVARRRDMFKEADRLITEAQLRQRRLDEFKEKKLKELKDTGLCEKYCSQVERKARTCDQ
uniref:Cilia- and flagella-associated protein 45 n=1 Tax=Scophthalmus maximus TaxID=52904 RepID=A0A8D2ZQ45_SCOMX